MLCPIRVVLVLLALEQVHRGGWVGHRETEDGILPIKVPTAQFQSRSWEDSCISSTPVTTRLVLNQGLGLGGPREASDSPRRCSNIAVA